VDGYQPIPPLPPLLSMSDLQALAQAIASGVQSVQYADRMVRYNSLADMLKAFSFGMALLGYGGRPTTRYAAFGKGLLGGGRAWEHAENTGVLPYPYGPVCPLWGTR
jgi:hypothetical protein